MSAKERRQREKEQRREQIVDAARAILLKHGLAAVTMNKIARAAELSVGTLYLYFQNKEDLFATLQEEGLDLLHELIVAADGSGKTPAERLRLIAEAYLTFARRHQNYFDVMNYFLTAPEMVFPDDLKRQIDKHGDRILSVAARAIRELTPHHDERSAHRCALVLWSNLHGMLQFRKLQNTILAQERHEELYFYAVDCLLASFSVRS